MCAELVRFVSSVVLRPPRETRRAVFANAVTPIVGFGEATAGPTDDGRMDGAQLFYCVKTEALYVGDLRIRTDPDAVIDHAADVLGKMTEDLGGNGTDDVGCVDLNLIHM